MASRIQAAVPFVRQADVSRVLYRDSLDALDEIVARTRPLRNVCSLTPTGPTGTRRFLNSIYLAVFSAFPTFLRISSRLFFFLELCRLFSMPGSSTCRLKVQRGQFTLALWVVCGYTRWSICGRDVSQHAFAGITLRLVLDSYFCGSFVGTTLWVICGFTFCGPLVGITLWAVCGYNFVGHLWAISFTICREISAALNMRHVLSAGLRVYVSRDTFVGQSRFAFYGAHVLGVRFLSIVARVQRLKRLKPLRNQETPLTAENGHLLKKKKEKKKIERRR